jgi:crotonobetainyl-CoA:carnitine CoA-transferase CaiB-like acyl-CoA transferase
MSMALEGIRVIDLTLWHQGAMAATILGDLGAEVIKIEDRVKGDPARGFMQIIGASTGVMGRNAYFEHCNRNKKSITLDLTKQKGRQIAYQLVEKSDVFLHNMRKGVPERLGMDYKTLSQYNPRLIYASASGWGPKGPAAGKPSFDMTGIARSGMMTVAGEPGTPPVNIQGMGDQIGAIMTAFSVVTAIAARERLGVGQEVEVSLLGSLVYLLGMYVDVELLVGHELPRFVRAKAGNPLWNYYRCKDDKWIVLAHIQSDRYWPTLCRAVGIEHLEKDPRFENMDVRGKNAAELISIMDEAFATKTRAEWLDIFEKSGDLIFEAVNTISDMVKDPQVRANDYIVGFQHPAWGKIDVVGIPMHFSCTPPSVRLPAPEFGEHTEEVLQSVLGYSWDDIAKLNAEEVI